MRRFSLVAASKDYSLVAVHGLLTAVRILLCEAQALAHGLQDFWHVGSVVVVPGLQSTGSAAVVHGLSCSEACGIFWDQGSNLCLLH